MLENNKILGKRLDNDRNVGKLQITSLSYPEFKKEISNYCWAKDKDGKEAVVYIGKQVGENYYATVNDKKVVYIVEGVVVETLEFDLTVLTETEVAE